MTSPILGKWKEVGQEGLAEFFQAVGLPDPAPESEASFAYTLNEDGSYTETFDTGVEVTARTFTSGVETDGITTIVEGNVIKETDSLPDGKSMYVERVFEDTTMVSTLTAADSTAIKATIRFQKV